MGRVLLIMKGKKLSIAFIATIFLNACSSPTAMLGPVYTLSSTGNVLQAGLSYGSNEMITMYTGKTPIENIKDLVLTENTNIHRKTLESKDFHNLVKKRVESTRSVLKLSNQ
tara:strand:+ start:227 stop:562 length:336 start_codon:yes stop_codon:yes gene_type:complete